MRKSDVFNEFVKIAQEKGLISDPITKEAQTAEDSFKRLMQTGRTDSLSIEDIAKLYQVKPEHVKDMEYEHNISELAHPKPQIIAPSYDRLNGLVENLNEAQNITLNILNKCPSGRITQHKYANKQLLLSLVRTANDLDNQNQDQLCSLADHCLEQLSHKMMKKEGQLVLLGLAAALIGAIYAKNHLPFVSDGFRQDHQKLMGEIDDLINSSDSWGVGYTYKPQFISMLQDFKNQLQDYANQEAQVEPILDQLTAIRSPKQAIALAKQPEGSNIVNALYKFRQATDKIVFYITEVERNFSNPLYKQRQTQETGFLSRLVDSTKVFHGGYGLVADDFDDVVHALETYKGDIKNIFSILQQSSSIQQSAMTDLRNAATESQKLLGAEPSSPVATNAPVAAPTSPATSTPSAAPAPEEGFLGELSNIEQEMGQ